MIICEDCSLLNNIYEKSKRKETERQSFLERKQAVGEVEKEEKKRHTEKKSRLLAYIMLDEKKKGAKEISMFYFIEKK